MNSIRENASAFGHPLRAHQHMQLNPYPYEFESTRHQGALCYNPYRRPVLQVATEPREYRTRTSPSIHPISPPSTIVSSLPTAPRTTMNPYIQGQPIVIPPQISPYSYHVPTAQLAVSNPPPIVPSKRPFKALTGTDAEPMVSMLHPALEAEYETLKEGIMATVAESGSNRNMRRNFPVNPEKLNDREYLEKRRKNNEAAKKSREARKTKEDETAIRVKFLDGHAVKMAYQLSSLEREKIRLTEMLNRVFNSSNPIEK